MADSPASNSPPDGGQTSVAVLTQPLLPVSYRVFISHSAPDRAAVDNIVATCKQVGVEPYIYEHDTRLGASVAEKVKENIIASDAVVLLLTRHSSVSPYVQQEIGFALAHGKPVLPLVEEGVSEDKLAMLKGVEWVAFNPESSGAALRAMGGEIERLRGNKQYRQDVFVMLGLVAFLLIAGYAVAKAS